jgi:hypothetical protein
MAEDNAGGIMRSGSPQFKNFKLSGSGGGGGFFSNFGKEMANRSAEERQHNRNIEMATLGHVFNSLEAEQAHKHNLATIGSKTNQSIKIARSGLFSGKFTHEQGDTKLNATIKAPAKPRTPRSAASAKPAASPKPRTPRGAK